MLQTLLTKTSVEKTLIFKHTQSLDYIINSKERDKKIVEIKASLEDFNISKSMKTRLAKIGISRNILCEAYQTGGYDGLSILLGEHVDGKPRVTCNKKLLMQYFYTLKAKKKMMLLHLINN